MNYTIFIVYILVICYLLFVFIHLLILFFERPSYGTFFYNCVKAETPQA